MHFSNLFVSSLCLAGSTLAASVDQKSILTSSANRWARDTTVSFPKDSFFTAATERWTIFRPPTYWAAVSPANEEDVAKVVKIAKTYKLPFLATGGRHGYGVELGNLQNGIALDLSKMNTVKVDKRAGTLTVGPGARFRDIVNPVWDAGYEIQTGSCSCPGVLGVTVGAGVGRLQGAYGLLIDALISARVVTADGKILEVSEKKNPDLFWAIRGAGANFGVLVEAKYRIQPNPTKATFTSVDVIFTPDQNASYFNLLQSMIHRNDGSPAGLTSKLSVSSAIIFNSTLGMPLIAANWAWKGPREEALRVMKPMLDLNPALTVTLDLPWRDLNTASGFGTDAELCIPGKMNNVYSANLKKFDSATHQRTFAKMAQFYTQYPDARGSTVLIESFPTGAVSRISNTATAYPWRDSVSYVLLQFSWAGASNAASSGPADAKAQELRRDYAAASGYNGLSVYVNYAHGDETPQQVYGQNLPRLTKLKKQYDPDNMFGYNMVVPRR